SRRPDRRGPGDGDYPAGLNCTLVQNPRSRWRCPSATSLSPRIQTRWWLPVALAGGLLEHLLVPPPGWRCPGLRRAAPATDCMDTHGCVWVNIGVNLHYRDKTNVLEGTLNETMPGNQTCPDPTSGEPVAVGPSQFVSKPNPGCLFVTVNDL